MERVPATIWAGRFNTARCGHSHSAPCTAAAEGSLPACGSNSHAAAPSQLWAELPAAVAWAELSAALAIAYGFPDAASAVSGADHHVQQLLLGMQAWQARSAEEQQAPLPRGAWPHGSGLEARFPRTARTEAPCQSAPSGSSEGKKTGGQRRQRQQQQRRWKPDAGERCSCEERGVSTGRIRSFGVSLEVACHTIRVSTFAAGANRMQHRGAGGSNP